MLARRTLDELALRNRIGKAGEREIYVEGIQDKVILDHLLERRGVRAAVYTAESIEVPHATLISRGLDAPSARNSVIAARCELLERGADLSNQIFLVDRDQEDLVNTPFIDGCLITDFGSLPTHLINDDSMIKLARLAGRGVISSDDLTRSVYDISRSLYLIRSAGKLTRIPIRILPPGHYISRSANGGYYFMFDEYIDACLKSCNLIRRKFELHACLEGCASRLDLLGLDPRVWVNDHELWVIVRAVLRLAGDGVNRSAEDVRDLFLMAFDENSLIETPMFEKLLAF